MIFGALRRRIAAWKFGQLATLWAAGFAVIATALVYYLATPGERRRIKEAFGRQVSWWDEYETAMQSRADSAKLRLRLIAELERHGAAPTEFTLAKTMARDDIDRAWSASYSAIRVKLAAIEGSAAAQEKRTTFGDVALLLAGATFVTLLVLTWLWFGEERPTRHARGPLVE
jgi:hypothetical protein